MPVDEFLNALAGCRPMRTSCHTRNTREACHLSKGHQKTKRGKSVSIQDYAGIPKVAMAEGVRKRGTQ